MNDITNAFISHLIENKYVGPGVPTTVGITESYLKRVFDMVFKQQYSRNNHPIDDISPSEVIQFMVTNGYLVIDHGQVAAFPQHNIVCPITTSIIPSIISPSLPLYFFFPTNAKTLFSSFGTKLFQLMLKFSFSI